MIIVFANCTMVAIAMLFCSVILYCCYVVSATNATIPCTTPNGESAFCTSLYSCQPLLKSLGSLRPAELAFVKQSECGILDTFLVCCGNARTFQTSFLDTSMDEKHGRRTTPPTRRRVTVRSTRSSTPVITSTRNNTSETALFHSNANTTIAHEKTSTVNNYSTVVHTNISHLDTSFLLADRRYCGLQHTDDRFYEDNATAIDEFPWLALLPSLQNGKKVPICSGTIINRRYVLTGASCVSLFKVTAVQLGLYHREKAVQCVENPNFPECTDPAIEIEIEETIIHDSYVPFITFNYNIALLRVAKTLEFTDYIRPICLPMNWSKSPEVGEILFASGWGSQKVYGEPLVEIKKRISQKLISNEECISRNPDIPIDDMIICTSPQVEEENQVCTGDTGGPLMHTYKHQWFMEGIVFGAVGDKNCTGQIVSTRITSYMKWILGKMRE